jgi:hypothetical protein
MAISDNLRNSLVTAGLGILGANRPGASFGQAVGQGGLLGLQAYNQGLAQQKIEEEQAQRQEALQSATQGMSPEFQQLAMAYPELAANILAKKDIAAFEEGLVRSRPQEPLSIADRFQNVPGVGLVDLSDPNNPQVVIQGQEGPDTIINNIPGMAESEFAKQTAKSGADAVQALQEGINSRAQQKALIDNILAVSDDAPSGPLANVELFAGNLGQAFGIPTEGVAQGEILRAASNQLALLVRGNPEGGLPGAASNRDVQFLLNSGPTLAQSKAGRKALAKITKETLNYRDRLAKAEQDYRQKNRGSVVGFNPSSIKKPDLSSIIAQARKEVNGLTPETSNYSAMSDSELLKVFE